MLCSGQSVLVYSLNGRLILEDNVCDTTEEDDVITACACYEGIGNEWMARELLFTGHRNGVVNVSSLQPLCNRGSSQHLWQLTLGYRRCGILRWARLQENGI